MFEFSLATHTRAAIKGYDVTLDEKTHPLFKGIEEWCFYVPGRSGDRLVKTAHDFFDLLRRTGIEDAWYGRETATFEEYWGIVTIWRGERYIWSTRTSKASEGIETWRRCSVRAQRSTDSVSPPTVTVAVATAQFLNSVERCIEFGQEYRAQEPHFLDEFIAALEYLRSDAPPPEWTPHEFPSVGYPTAALRLRTASHLSPAASGPDTWGNWQANDEEIQSRFLACNREYIRAKYSILTATSISCEKAR